jgi:hypothetical protein
MGKFPAQFFESAEFFLKNSKRRKNFQTFLNRQQNFQN